MTYEAVIGLEIHTELSTKTKMFCESLNNPNEKHPNVNICPVCMGHPGTLPVINEEAVRKVISLGLALNAVIPEFSQFDRKNYFYPDLPKGYQISQYQHPLVQGGDLVIESDGNKKRIRITRVHLEEDTGRLIHDLSSNASLVDFNRAGVPLMELVTEPDFRSGKEVREFGEALQQIIRYLEVSNADMEKGEMRVEVNISMRRVGEEAFGTKVEIKNINSFKYVEDAVSFEIDRQTKLLERGEKVIQETRGWNEKKGETFSQRSKEEAHDYRYFPEPDLPPLELSLDMVDELRAALPELPHQKKLRFAKEFGLDARIIDTLIKERALAHFFENVISEVLQLAKESSEETQRDLIVTSAQVLTGDFLYLLKKNMISVHETKVSPENFAELTLYFAENKISNLALQDVLGEIILSGEDPSDVIEKKNLWQISDTSDLESIVSDILKENPKAAQDYREGKEASLQFLVGQVMKESRGKANPKIVQEIIKKSFQ